MNIMVENWHLVFVVCVSAVSSLLQLIVEIYGIIMSNCQLEKFPIGRMSSLDSSNAKYAY